MMKLCCCSGIQKNVFVAMVASATVGYNVSAISLGAEIIKQTHDLSTAMDAWLTAAILLGLLIGQIAFGLAGDIVGRRQSFLLACGLILLGAISSAFASGSSIWFQIITARTLLGLGCGGMFPLTAAITADTAGEGSTTILAALVFSMQGVGYLLVPLITLVCDALNIVKDTSSWRLIFAFGALPVIVLLRLGVEETLTHSSLQPTFRRSDGTSRRRFLGEAPEKPMGSFMRTLAEALHDEHQRSALFGIALTWFLFDFIFYGNLLFQSELVETIDDFDDIRKLVLLNLVLMLIALPGFYIALAALMRLPAKSVQIRGFLIMAALFMVMALLLPLLRSSYAGTVGVYGLMFAAANAGPNTMTFVLPAQVFEQQVRATTTGVCAASGKLGALLGTLAFLPLQDNSGIEGVLWVCFMLCVVAAIATFHFVPHTGMEIQELDAEFDEFSEWPECCGLDLRMVLTFGRYNPAEARLQRYQQAERMARRKRDPGALSAGLPVGGGGATPGGQQGASAIGMAESSDGGPPATELFGPSSSFSASSSSSSVGSAAGGVGGGSVPSSLTSVLHDSSGHVHNHGAMAAATSAPGDSGDRFRTKEWDLFRQNYRAAGERRERSDRIRSPRRDHTPSAGPGAPGGASPPPPPSSGRAMRDLPLLDDDEEEGVSAEEVVMQPRLSGSATAAGLDHVPDTTPLTEDDGTEFEI